MVLERTRESSRDLRATPRVDEHGGLNTFLADFYSDYRRIRASLVSPEIWLSDHLNSSSTAIDVQPLFAQRHGTQQSDLSQSRAQISKSRVLFVVPLSEPNDAGSKAVAWRPTDRHRCWAALGPYQLMGEIYSEPGRDPHIAIGQMGRQFIPLTGVTLYCPDGSIEHHNTILVNRTHLDVLAIHDA
jgi:hypothetical protein